MASLIQHKGRKEGRKERKLTCCSNRCRSSNAGASAAAAATFLLVVFCHVHVHDHHHHWLAKLKLVTIEENTKLARSLAHSLPPLSPASDFVLPSVRPPVSAGVVPRRRRACQLVVPLPACTTDRALGNRRRLQRGLKPESTPAKALAAWRRPATIK